MGTKSKTKKYVVVRSHMAGVFIGEITSMDISARCVTLRRSIRLWTWHGGSLSQVATEGHGDTTKKTGLTLDGDHIVFDVVEVMPSNEKAYNRIAALPGWRV